MVRSELQKRREEDITDGVRERGQGVDGGDQVGFQGLFQNCESRQ